MATQNLGIVTAYGYAKKGGYTGTEEEFYEALAKVLELTNGTGVENGINVVNGKVCVTYEED